MSLVEGAFAHHVGGEARNCDRCVLGGRGDVPELWSLGLPCACDGSSCSARTVAVLCTNHVSHVCVNELEMLEVQKQLDSLYTDALHAFT